MLHWPDLGRPFVFGHRGASAHAPENTLPAFEQALAEGADGLEFDVKLSQDGRVVVMHDATLERTTDGRGRVNRHSLEALRGLDAAAHFPAAAGRTQIPTLEEVLDRFGRRTILNIELTNYTSPLDALVPRVLALVRRFGLQDRVLLSSFFPQNLWLAGALAPRVYRGMLSEANALGRLVDGGLWRLGCQALHPHLDSVTPALVQAVHRRGGRVHVYTVNRPEDMRRLRDWGVDAIFTDDPALARKIFSEQT